MNTRISDNKVSTLQEYLSSQLSALYDARESANIVAELFRHFKQWNRADVMMNKETRISESEILQFHFAAKRLAKGEPLQYILGKTWFRGLEMKVTPDVLIPRPETEELVQLILDKNRHDAPHILDIGTGSGCIAIALKKEIPTATVYALDISEAALTVAKENAIRNNAEINYIHQDILIADFNDLKFDIIVSNPPYIPYAEKDEMRKQVTEHEPSLALFVPDNDALLFYRRIIALAKKHLSSNGKAFCEIHENMQTALTEELTKQGILDFEFVKDLQGKTRMLFFI